jgi:hypothetical protein
MKRLNNLGNALSRDQQKKILGGSMPEDGSCNLIIKCNSECYARPNCPSECTHTDTTVTCGSVTYTNSSVCAQAGC